MNSSSGNRIRQARRARGMTQEALAAAVGVSRSAIAQWETGRSGQLIANVTSVCKVLDIDAADLVHGFADAEAPISSAGDAASLQERWQSGDEVALVRLYRVCSPGDQQLLLMAARRLSQNSE